MTELLSMTAITAPTATNFFILISPATDLIDDLDADKFSIFTGRENSSFVPMTPPSNKNKSDQSNSATNSASKGSARKGNHISSPYACNI